MEASLAAKINVGGNATEFIDVGQTYCTAGCLNATEEASKCEEEATGKSCKFGERWICDGWTICTDTPCAGVCPKDYYQVNQAHIIASNYYHFSTVSSLQSYYWQPEGLLTQC